MARRAEPNTLQDLWADGAAWLDRYERWIAAEIEAQRLAAPGVPASNLRVMFERGASPLDVARYYAAQRN